MYWVDHSALRHVDVYWAVVTSCVRYIGIHDQPDGTVYGGTREWDWGVNPCRYLGRGSTEINEYIVSLYVDFYSDFYNLYLGQNRDFNI